MSISKLAVSAAAVATVAIGGQAAASAASASTSHPAAPPGPRAVRAAAARSVIPTYTVRPGDTLSGIGARFGIGWEGLYAANRPVVGPNPNLIFPGQVLSLTGAPRQQSAQPEPAQSGSPSEPGQPGSQAAQAQQHSAPARSSATSSGDGAPGSFQQCVIQRESSGNAQVMNSSGHYGLYQFSLSTWVAAGGNPADFGHASVSEQNAVFQTAFAEWGASPWAPYDGC